MLTAQRLATMAGQGSLSVSVTVRSDPVRGPACDRHTADATIIEAALEVDSVISDDVPEDCRRRAPRPGCDFNRSQALTPWATQTCDCGWHQWGSNPGPHGLVAQICMQGHSVLCAELQWELCP